MKTKIYWIYFLTCFFLVKICGSTGVITDVVSQDNQLITVPVENDRQLLKIDATNDFSKEIQPFQGLLEPVEPESRLLRKRKSKNVSRSKTSRRKRASKKKSKALKKGKKAKKSRKNKYKGKDKDKEKKSRAERKRDKKFKKERKRKEKLMKKGLLKPEDESLEDENLSNDEILNDLDNESDWETITDLPYSSYPLDEDDSLEALDSSDSSDSSDETDSTDSTDLVDSVDPIDTSDVDLYYKGKKYWNSEMIEPEYIISEWFAILDGKKFDKKSGTKSPYVKDGVNKFGTNYLLTKKKNSKYLMNKYSSGWKYGTEEDDKMDYVTPIIISNESLRRTYPDTREDEVENRIIDKKFKQNQNHYNGRRELKTYNSSRNRKYTTGSYDLPNDYRENLYGVKGTYRKLDDSEIENYTPQSSYEEVSKEINKPEIIDNDINNFRESDDLPVSEGEITEERESQEEREERYNSDQPNVEQPLLKVDPEMISTTEKLEEVKQLLDESDQLNRKIDDKLDQTEESEESEKLDNKLDEDLDDSDEMNKKLDDKSDGENDLDLYEDNYLKFDDYDFEEPTKKYRKRNIRDNDLYESKRIKKLSKKKCQQELLRLKRKYKKMANDIIEKASE